VAEQLLAFQEGLSSMESVSQLVGEIRKAKLSLCITKHYAMKTYGGVDIETHVFLTSALVGSGWSASRPSRLTPREKAPCAHSIEGWVGPRAGLDDMEKHS
jgi:hypothetical protein